MIHTSSVGEAQVFTLLLSLCREVRTVTILEPVRKESKSLQSATILRWVLELDDPSNNKAQQHNPGNFLDVFQLASGAFSAWMFSLKFLTCQK